MPTYDFATPEPIDLYVEIGSGSIRVDAREQDDAERATTTHVEVTGDRADEVTVTQSGSTISVLGPRQGMTGFLGRHGDLDVTVTLPARSSLVTKLGSADLVTTGPLGAGRIRSGSGEVSVETLTGASTIQTGSGEVSVDRAEGHLKVQSGSGDVRLGVVRAETSVSTGSGDVSIGETETAAVVKTGSGDLEIASTRGDASFSTGSGDLHIRTAERGRLVTKGASGDVQIGVRAGVPVFTDVHTVTGRIRSTLQGAGRPEPGQDHVEVRTTTVSGDVVLTET